MTTRCVYDCMLFFRAVIRPQRVRPLFDYIRGGQVTLCLGANVLSEIRDVLTRPKLTAKYPALTQEAVDAFLAEVLGRATWIDDVSDQYVLERDPKDSKYLNLAIAAAAPYVVSDDLDLLELIAEDSAVGVDFRKQFPEIKILTPAAFESLIATIR